MNLKTLMAQRIVVKRQRDEFGDILSSVPHGILLARQRDAAEVRAEIAAIREADGVSEAEAGQQVLPFESQYVNSELRAVLGVIEDAAPLSCANDLEGAGSEGEAEERELKAGDQDDAEKFARSARIKVFQRFVLGQQGGSRARASAFTTQSLAEILQEGWVGSQIYRLRIDAGSSASLSSLAAEG